MSERVVRTIDSGVADVRLNRPDKLNALDGDLILALVEAGARLSRDTAVRAVVLSGEGRAFSAGLDFSGFMAMAGGGRGTVDRGGGITFQATAGMAVRDRFGPNFVESLRQAMGATFFVFLHLPF